jgi:predicted permease
MSLLTRIANVFRPDRLNREIQEEFDAHISEAIENGRDPLEARRALGHPSGHAYLHRQQAHDIRVLPWLDGLRLDLRFALRQLLRSPGFTFTVVLTLALAIGANTAIFSLVDALLLKSLPYPHPDRLAAIFARYSGAAADSPQGQPTSINGQQWEQLRDSAPSLIAAVSSGMASGINLQPETQSAALPGQSAARQAQYLHAGRVSARYFEVLEIPILLGRSFSLEEDRPGGPPAAILSYSLWRTLFHADRSILGQSIHLKGEPYTVVGILPDTPTPLNADIYTALQPSRNGEGGGTNFDAILRLQPSATWQQANAEINRAFAERAARIHSRDPGVSVYFYAAPLQKAQVGDLRPQVLALMLAAGCILLIACANLAGLTLVRTMRRTAEIATRMALGASRWQIQRQLWLENLLLALLGGAAGVATGFLALHGLLALLPENFLPVTQVPLNGQVLAFTLIVSLFTSLLVGMLPALTTRKIDIRSAIATRGSSAHNRLRLRQALIAGEVALTVVLLAASGLLIRTLIYFQSLPPGFNPSGVLTAKASLDDLNYRSPAAFQRLMDQSTAAMRQIPGVENAAVGLSLPYERALNDNVTLRDDAQAGREILTAEVYATPGYFETLQIPLLAGRAFADSDNAQSQPVVLVNQTFARKFLPNQNPIGHYLNKDLRIVGVVSDVAAFPALESLDVPVGTEETIYIPAAQMDAHALAIVHIWFQPSWIVRTAHPIAGLTGQMQRALTSVDPNLPFSGFYSMSDLLAKTLSTQRIEVALLSAMAALALLLSALGIFSLVANMVLQRTREIGIRIALGSTLRQAMVHVGSSGAAASALGLLTGLGLSAIALRAMQSFLFGVKVYDPLTILAVVVTLILITLLAITIPTLRIASIDPATTLRED